jgi:hypothetical protein
VFTSCTPRLFSVRNFVYKECGSIYTTC